VAVANETLTSGEPKVSSRARRAVVRTTFPSADSVRLPSKENLRVRVRGSDLNDVVGWRHGSGANSTGGRLSMPFGMPLRNRSNHIRTSVDAYSYSAGGFGAGVWPKSPR